MSVEEGWSVRKTQVRDFRGGELTYDSTLGQGTVARLALPVEREAARA